MDHGPPHVTFHTCAFQWLLASSHNLACFHLPLSPLSLGKNPYRAQHTFHRSYPLRSICVLVGTVSSLLPSRGEHQSRSCCVRGAHHTGTEPLTISINLSTCIQSLSCHCLLSRTTVVNSFSRWRQQHRSTHISVCVIPLSAHRTSTNHLGWCQSTNMVTLTHSPCLCCT